MQMLSEVVDEFLKLRRGDTSVGSLRYVLTVLRNISNRTVNYVLHERSYFVEGDRLGIRRCFTSVRVFSFDFQREVDDAVLDCTDKLLEFDRRNLTPNVMAG